MSGEPILIVEDNELNLKLTRVLLAKEGFQVRTASSAEEAIEILKGFKPRLILMDIQLPGVNGLELTRKLKADPATSGAIIIALTAYALKGDDDNARAAGCDGYITKPIDTRTLPKTLRSYLSAPQ